MNVNMRKLLSRVELVDSLYSQDIDYMVNINEAVRSLFQARTIIRKYIKTTDIKDRLLLNHIIIVNNLLGVKRTNFALYNSLTDTEFSYIKSVLLFIDIYDIEFGSEVDEDEPLLELFNDTLKRFTGS